jgi:hypothetical protein
MARAGFSAPKAQKHTANLSNWFLIDVYGFVAKSVDERICCDNFLL